jgi:hypothetical protein
MSGLSAPLAPFTINETNSNFEQFHEKFPTVEENGRVDAHLTRFLRGLLPVDVWRRIVYSNWPPNAREFHFLLTLSGR